MGCSPFFPCCFFLGWLPTNGSSRQELFRGFEDTPSLKWKDSSFGKSKNRVSDMSEKLNFLDQNPCPPPNQTIGQKHVGSCCRRGSLGERLESRMENLAAPKFRGGPSNSENLGIRHDLLKPGSTFGQPDTSHRKQKLPPPPHVCMGKGRSIKMRSSKLP